ncbi:hypothetical protein RclHR1_32340001 [Rhizophagus clarus]|uniref:Uncharacterized protein n=1 Tax=Rhizophagus clarus TaxID=94130 RepID=A0A2Z6R8D7_9GLOM|nr:hypothetical protein RclHR1_32340001 [Rhizophagus clarus]GES83625.1 hypothetical protein RCL_jg19900.t1 [Rhizophagus clarus]
MRQATKASHYLNHYNKTFYKVIKHLPLSHLWKNLDALLYIPTREHIIAWDQHINSLIKKPKIPNQNDLSNFNPISDELLAEDQKDKLAELLPFIPHRHIFNNSGTIEFPPGSP